ncbi:NTP transferase domain-containing protein [Microbulbifer sp. SAOS-129_SWC]|uniref:NTP transferase domain-containing protein n=1 Tax=Microbulbifer sp. SAOS-129_SWC TaxID=3145235 RepID=UPI0032177CCA
MAERLRICPLVLAGGQSRRMGRDKAALQLPGGETLLSRAINLLQSLPTVEGIEWLSPRVSGARPGGIADRGPARGPLSGLWAVSESLREAQVSCDGLLAVPVDMPLLQRTQLLTLCRAARAGASAACFGRYRLPLWLRLDDDGRSYLRRIAAGDGGGDASLGALLAALGGEQLPVPAGDWHCNVNRPEEFARVNARLDALSGPQAVE